jgi:DNA repair exonuclease SbcCD ATPase subunit
MSDELERTPPRTFSGLFLGALALALVAALGALAWTYRVNVRLHAAEQQLSDARAENDRLSRRLEQTGAQLEATAEKIGMSQRALEARADQLMARQQSSAQRLESYRTDTSKQISGVSSEVSNVRSDVGGVKTDVARTQNDLQSAVSQMQAMRGDMGVMSGLIARNHDELEILKHKGDRTYTEFTLTKGDKRPVGTVTLELRKADAKHSRYTLYVYADDKKIEKKDKGLNEPVQFYTGKDPALYELVVNSIDKNRVVGYLSAPKNAPQAATIP